MFRLCTPPFTARVADETILAAPISLGATINSAVLLACPYGVVTWIRPEPAPDGMVNAICELVSDEGVIIVLPSMSVVDPGTGFKLLPDTVTLVPTSLIAVGANVLIVGARP